MKLHNRSLKSFTAATLLATGAFGTTVSAQASTTKPPPAVDAAGKTIMPVGHPSADTAAVFVSLLATVNRDEIGAGKLAASRATRPEVRAYAQKMVAEHAAALDSLKANADAGSWVVKDTAGNAPTGAKSADSAGVSEMSTPSLSMAMTEAALHGANAQAMQTLQASNGAAFDRAYIDSQVKGHEAVLKAITGLSTGNEKLQKQITNTQKSTEIHLDEARKMQKSMAAAGGAQTP